MHLAGILEGIPVQWQDTDYRLPLDKVVWESLWAWGLQYITPCYQEPNIGLDCEDLARAAVHFAKWQNGQLSIGTVKGLTDIGTPHVWNVVVWEGGYGYLDFTPRYEFLHPPPLGVMGLPTGWQVEEIRL